MPMGRSSSIISSTMIFLRRDLDDGHFRANIHDTRRVDAHKAVIALRESGSSVRTLISARSRLTWACQTDAHRSH
jgi:hypothetical protein